MKETKVLAADDGIQLRRWFQKYHPGTRYGDLQKMLRKKLVRVDGARAEATQLLSKGQIIKHPEFDEALAKAEPKNIEKPDWIDNAILYQDTNLIIMNKPAGLPTQGGSKQTTHLDRLLPLLAEKDAPTPRLTHRLDKDTSGVLILAKSAKVADKLMKAFTNKLIHKEYLALCAGVPSRKQGDIKIPLAKRLFGGEEKMAPAENGKHAHTTYEVIENLAQTLSLVILSPMTGRKHQLRAHMAYLECPIIGDGKYGGEDAFPEGLQIPKKMHLHARKITIPEECFGKEITVEAPLPDHFIKSFNRLEIQYR